LRGFLLQYMERYKPQPDAHRFQARQPRQTPESVARNTFSRAARKIRVLKKTRQPVPPEVLQKQREADSLLARIDPRWKSHQEHKKRR